MPLADRVVTVPTNGAAGAVPAVLRYYRDLCAEASDEHLRIFLPVAAAVGSIIKQNAPISGAEVGCQVEVGSAAAMAAAGLAAVLGGSNEQIENAVRTFDCVSITKTWSMRLQGPGTTISG